MNAKTPLTPDPLRIGTRDSKLAVWQAEYVQNRLQQKGYTTELVYIKTEGDQIQNIPIHQIGGQGVFTKALDDALLENRIDIAVHSCKDLPTTLPDGISIAAIPIRENAEDVLVSNGDTGFLHDKNSKAVIATGSNRRRGQWLSRYPNHTLTDVRGNVQTRLKKLKDNGWDGIIFAAAGLRRLELAYLISERLEWMLPAPAQGALAVATREDDDKTAEIAGEIHEPSIAAAVTAERTFLRILEGGCSAPIGANALIDGNKLIFRGQLNSLNGDQTIRIEMKGNMDEPEQLGEMAAGEAKSRGAEALVAEVRSRLESGD